MCIKLRIILWAGLLLSLTLPQQLPAQAVYGSIIGVVSDPTGAAIAGAKVVLRDLDRDITAAAVTNSEGNYSFSHLIVGRYAVTVENPGFRQFVESNINVSVDAEVRLDRSGGHRS